MTPGKTADTPDSNLMRPSPSIGEPHSERMSGNLRIVALLLMAGFFLHFVQLEKPEKVVFDEVHWGAFADAYCCSGEYFFDIHPPHGKLIAALVMKLGGYQGGQSFATIGTPLSNINPVLLRAAPAFFGSMIPVLVFIVLSQLGVSRWGAFLGGWAALWDNALLLQTRILALDGTLVFSILTATALALLAVRQTDATRQRACAILAGLFVGFAAGVKLTGLAAAIPVAVVLLASKGRDGYWKHLVALYVCVGFAALLVYLSGWFLHFTLLDQPGPGDIWGKPSANVVTATIEIHRSILQANFGLQATHPNSSEWWSWPWMWRPIYYFAASGSQIYFVGNPVVWWGTSIGLIAAMITTASRAARWRSLPAYRGSVPLKILVPAAGFLISYVPYIFIPRIMFLYHYLPALVFAIIGVAAVLDSSGWTRPGGLSNQPARFYALLCVIPLGFVVISPLTFGLDWWTLPAILK